MTRRRPLTLLLALALAAPPALGGCKKSTASTAAADASPAGDGDVAHLDPRDAGGSLAAVEAGAPPDDAMPPASSDELTQRARHLLEALGRDDPDLAADIMFPRDGWLGTRDAVDPGKDWDKHVQAPFRKSVHALARKRERLDGARFVSFELGHAVVQATPRRHGFKKGLWTVHGSRLTYLVDGHTRVLSVREMTAWRGAWYVTRLR